MSLSDSISDSEDIIDETICSISISGINVGISFYFHTDERVEICEISLADSLELFLSNLFTKRMPTKILLNAKISEDIPNTINEAAKDITYEKPPQILFQKPILYDYKKALERIIETFCPLSASSQLDDSQTTNRAFLLPSIIDTEAKEMIRSLDCLLNYIVTFQSHDLMEGDAPSCHIRAFTLLQLDNYMMIDRYSLHSLDIYSMVTHPSLIKGMGREKQGFTMFNLLDRTKTSIGRQVLKQ